MYAVYKHRLLGESADPARIRRTTARLVRNLLIFAGLAMLTLIFSMQIDILAYFWVYLLVEFVVFVIHRTRRLFLHRKLAAAEKSNGVSSKNIPLLESKEDERAPENSLSKDIVGVILLHESVMGKSIACPMHIQHSLASTNI
ncbi:MAG TPA: hypothetical protein VNW73_07035 [Ktedonobacteraceae bacterium]|nr:hypothetical protein [Ktedonobacteraceae bacterium]